MHCDPMPPSLKRSGPFRENKEQVSGRLAAANRADASTLAAQIKTPAALRRKPVKNALDEIELCLGPVDALLGPDHHALHEIAGACIVQLEAETHALILNCDAAALERAAVLDLLLRAVAHEDLVVAGDLGETVEIEHAVDDLPSPPP